jgi:hypothetical protein
MSIRRRLRRSRLPRTVAARVQPVADRVEAAVQAGRADDLAAFALPLGGAPVKLRAEGVVPAVNPGAKTDAGVPNRLLAGSRK